MSSSASAPEPTAGMSPNVMTSSSPTSSTAAASEVEATATETAVKAKVPTRLPPLTARSLPQTSTDTVAAAGDSSGTTSSATPPLPLAAAPVPPPPKTPQLEEKSKPCTPPTPDSDKHTTTLPTRPIQFRPSRPGLTPTSRSNLSPSPHPRSHTPTQPRSVFPQSPPQLSPPPSAVVAVAPVAPVLGPQHRYPQPPRELTTLQPPSSLPSLLQPQRQQLPPLRPTPPAQPPPLSGLQVPRLRKPSACPLKLPPINPPKRAASSGGGGGDGGNAEEEVDASLQRQQQQQVLNQHVIHLPRNPQPASAGGCDRERRVFGFGAQECATAFADAGRFPEVSSTSVPTSLPSVEVNRKQQQRQERSRPLFARSPSTDNYHDGQNDGMAAVGAAAPQDAQDDILH
ncbi:hypothetical protein Vretifemale_12916, partial [Volvox reticuliferus]